MTVGWMDVLASFLDTNGRYIATKQFNTQRLLGRGMADPGNLLRRRTCSGEIGYILDDIL